MCTFMIHSFKEDFSLLLAWRHATDGMDGQATAHPRLL